MDFSELQTYIDCPERYRLRYQEGLRKIQAEEEEQPLDFGAAVHAGLAEFYRRKPQADIEKAFLDIYPSAYGDKELVRTPENGLFLLRNYPPFALANDRQGEVEWEILAIEVVDSIKIGDLEWLVKIDLLIKTPSGIWIVDHKTTAGGFGDKFWNRFEMLAQFTGYSSYVLQKYGQCSGVILNAISLNYREKPELLDLSEEKEALSYTFREKKFSKYHKKEMWYAWGFHSKNERQVFNRLPQQIEDWKKEVHYWMKKLNQSKVGGEWGKNTTLCTYCEFRELCMACADPQVQEVLYEKYDPRAYLKEGK